MARRSSVVRRFLIVPLCALLLSNLPAQTFSVLHYFTNWDEGLYPVGGLIVDGNTLYGTTRVSVFKVNTDGSDFAVLAHYTNSDAGLLGMTAPLLLAGNTLYGTASQGGSNNLGTIFKINTDGTGYAVLKNFTGTPDGASPYYDGLTLSGATLYGTTMSGGTNGSGTVFKINTNGSGYAVLKSFAGDSDGGGPKCRLVLDGSTLYGVTGFGGSNGCCGGTVFRLNTDGSDYSILKHFGASDAEGTSPVGGLVLNEGRLYGITGNGGSNHFGTVFGINTNGTGFAILHHFVSNPGNARPWMGVILFGDTLYGTTANVGVPDTGTVFCLKTNGSDFATIQAFSGYANANYTTNVDGASPQSGLVASGNALYGAASQGGLYLLGSNGLGTIYKINLSEPLKLLINDASFGLQSNVFGFKVAGQSNQAVVIEGCTNLLVPDWLPLHSNILGATPFYFSDPAWTNYPGRFYRARTL